MAESPKNESLTGRISPSCEKVREWILNYISERKLDLGDRVPSERIICRALGANRRVVARAFVELIAQ